MTVVFTLADSCSEFEIVLGERGSNLELSTLVLGDAAAYSEVYTCIFLFRIWRHFAFDTRDAIISVVMTRPGLF